MPKVYKRKQKEPINDEDMEITVTSVVKGIYSVRKAAGILIVNESTPHESTILSLNLVGSTAISSEVEYKILL